MHAYCARLCRLLIAAARVDQNPVILPESNVTMDRDIIARHLMSDATDPFNRSKLTLDMLKTDDELKVRRPLFTLISHVFNGVWVHAVQARIVAWKQQQSGEAKRQTDDQAPSEAPGDTGA
eukprot:COSAG02_NODE_410_length_22875_cov_43.282755_2_plen_121_part_00